MKVLAIAFLIGAVSAGFGPYLPSGWRPSGPAFFLPSEVQKPSDNSLKETLEVEAEGSNFLREYGPPKAHQSLPFASTEQAFAAIEDTNEVVNQESGSVRQTLEVATELIQTVVENQKTATDTAKEENTVEVATELAQPGVENVESATVVATAEVEEKAVKVAIEEQKVVETESDDVIESRSFAETEGEEGTTVVYEETDNGVTETAVDQVSEVVKQVTEALEQVTKKLESVQENDNANSDVVSAVQEREENEVSQGAERAGKSVDEVSESEAKQSDGVENIADALVQLENEIKSQQVQEFVDVKTVQEISRSNVQDVPEGFLEYGPPGFREYGPPKELLRSGDNVGAVESNETRRRRFSPKFRSARRASQ